MADALLQLTLDPLPGVAATKRGCASNALALWHLA